MTDTPLRPTDTSVPVLNAEDSKLAELGYTQKLDRSVGTLASFAIGFATIPSTDEGGLSLAAVNRMIAGAVQGVQTRAK